MFPFPRVFGGVVVVVCIVFVLSATLVSVLYLTFSLDMTSLRGKL